FMNNKQIKLIDEFVNNGVIKSGQFTLKSGLTSNIYIDLRMMISYPSSMKLLLSLIIDLMKQHNIDKLISTNQGKIHIVGCVYAGIPIASLLSVYTDLPMLIVRKERKTYGTKSLIEGKYNEGDSVILIDDIITTG